MLHQPRPSNPAPLRNASPTMAETAPAPERAADGTDVASPQTAGGGALLPLGPHPGRARLVLRVGVTGHRPNRLAGTDLALLHARVREVLERVARIAEEIAAAAGAAYAPDLPVLRLVSPLAEGADRIVAQQACALGFALQCPLPFHRDQYEQDFASPASRAEYRSLLDQATAVLELDGSRTTEHDRQAAYAAAGRVLLAQSDVLIAVWDGGDGLGQGGTASVVAQALHLAIPIIWVRAQAPHTASLLIVGADASSHELPLDKLRARLLDALLPPPDGSGSGTGRGAEGAARYFAERYPRWSILGSVWSIFRDLVGGARFHRPDLRAAPSPPAAAQAWRADWHTSPRLPDQVTGAIDRTVAPHFLWADALAGYYVSLYRSSFVLIWLLAAAAVFLALIGYAAGWAEHDAELEPARRVAAVLVLLAILLLWRLGHRRRWHARWIDDRLLAELFRQLRYLAPLGEAPAFSRPPAHSVAGDPRTTWMGWHLRAVTRELGLVHARITPAYLDACRCLIRDGLIGGQLDYHTRSGRMNEHLEQHLRLLGLGTFLGTLVAVLVSFVRHALWLTLLEAVLPALGAAFGAVRSQGELERLAQRSHAMRDYLAGLAASLDAHGSPPSLAALARTAEAASDAVITEVSDWRIVLAARPLDLPG